MFRGASAFNQDIGSWNVSNGEYFVSIAINTNTTVYKSNRVNHNLMLCLVIFIPARLACSKEHQHLIETLAIGMYPMVNTL